MQIDYNAIIEESVAHARYIMGEHDAQARESVHNQAARQRAQHAMDMAQLEFERQRALALATFCQAACVDFEAWLAIRKGGN